MFHLRKSAALSILLLLLLLSSAWAIKDPETGTVFPDTSRCDGAAARAAGLFVAHTREGHRPDLTDCPPVKLVRGKPTSTIGDPGPMGRLLVRGEYGHDIVDELRPLPHEPVVDKPGKGAFYATDLDAILKHRGLKQLVVCGVLAGRWARRDAPSQTQAAPAVTP